MMTDLASALSQPGSAISPDDPQRMLTVANTDGVSVCHVFIAGGTYTILVSGAETACRCCLIDMHVPAGDGPPSHRHDPEEMFTLFDGEVEFTFHREASTAKAGSTTNLPANAPHALKNASSKAARKLYLCASAGQEAGTLAASYRTELLKPTRTRRAAHEMAGLPCLNNIGF